MATRIKIEDIILAHGELKKEKLATFLYGCSERQRCFLAFVSTNPFLTDDEDALSYDQIVELNKSCKDKDKFLHYAKFTSSLRDLWLKYECARQQMKKALCYFTACNSKKQDALEAVNACNKALSYIPKETKEEAGNAMAAILDKGESIVMENDIFGIGVCYDPDKGLLVADVEDAQIVMEEGFNVYQEFVSEIKAYEKVFYELSRCKTVGKDGDAIFKPLLNSFEQLKSKEAFSIYKSIPSYEDMKMSEQDYIVIKENVKQWINEE